MTICIAAICEKNSKVIVASDRMITASHLSQQFEHGIPKMEKISNNCIAVTAGHALAPREIFINVRLWAQKVSNPPINEVVEKVKEEFNKLRVRQAEEKHLRSRGFKDINDFYAKSQMLPPQIIIPLNEELEKERLEVEILVAGVDSEGAHIYWITDPGISNCFDPICYSAVGSGEPHALHTFIAEDYDGNMSLKKSLFFVYEAKKNAENAPGVGEKSDFWVIDKNGVKKMANSILSELENIYNRKKLILEESNKSLYEDLEKLGGLDDEGMF